MIGLLKGEVIEKSLDTIIILIGGVGYEVHMGVMSLTEVKKNQEITVYIYTYQREDNLSLCGFLKSEQKQLFQNLLSVSGIGVKSALTIVDRGADKVKDAIFKSDVNFFTSIPRIGKKNAQKIIIELKSKVGDSSDFQLDQENAKQNSEIIEALLNFGFTSKEANEKIKKIPDNIMGLENKIKYALKNM